MLYIVFVVITLALEYFFSWSLQTIPNGKSNYLWDNLLSNHAFLGDILHFTISHLFLQLTIIIYAYFVGRKIAALFHNKVDKSIVMSVIYLAIKLFVYYKNSLLFPHSASALPFPSFLTTELSDNLITTCVLLLLIIPIAVMSFRQIINKFSNNYAPIPIVFAIVAITSWQLLHSSNPASANTTDKNIIFIGVDSVSWQHIESNLENLPTFSRLISSGFVWTNTITPLARTFPAWTSILTGKYPKEHNALFNLAPTSQVSKDNLANFLKKRGYRTIYAQDERRFNNIDESFGFDTVIGPKIGAADFILPIFADHPVSNVTYDTLIGEFLFPFIALNRASSATYSPSRFVNAIGEELNEIKQPVFLSVHLCLAHIPYTWSTSSAASINDDPHKQALMGLDRQLSQLISSLEARNLLENSTLVLFSDHGEQLQHSENDYFAVKDLYQGDKKQFHKKIENQLFLNISGHGSNLNSRSQYNSFMIFNSNGSISPLYGSSNKPVSLISLAPTALQLAGIDTKRFGDSLFTSRQNNAPVFIETGLVLNSITDIEHLDPNKILLEAASYYRIAENGYVELKTDEMARLNTLKHRGIISDNWAMLRILFENQEMNILVDTKTGKWTYDFESTFSLNAPTGKLLALLDEYYKP